MVAGHLVFVLLIWIPAVLHAQKAEQPCLAPQLDYGYVVPKKQMYPHEEKLSYACVKGYKPLVEGWWATSTCENGQWSPKPQCIDEKACLPPTVPNGKYSENRNGWYAEHRGIKVTCHDGYELQGQSDRGRCINGTWPSLPVCEKSLDACDEPPQIPHAVVIGLGHQEVFAANSKVLYECESGYTTDGTTIQTSVFCSAGNWTGIPSCVFFCVIQPDAKYGWQGIEVPETQYLMRGLKKNVPCPQWRGYYSIFECTYRGIVNTNCCHEHTINTGECH